LLDITVSNYSTIAGVSVWLLYVIYSSLKYSIGSYGYVTQTIKCQHNE